MGGAVAKWDRACAWAMARSALKTQRFRGTVETVTSDRPSLRGVLAMAVLVPACNTPAAEGSALAATRQSAPAVSVPGGATAPVAASSASAAPAPAPSKPPSEPPAQADVPRAYAKSRFVWVWPEPRSDKDWIGFLWTGAAVRLKSTTPIAGPGCKAYYAIEPDGYVCVDGKRATLDPKDPAYVALLPYALKANSPWPHQYGESIGLPRYFKTPTAEHQAQRENDLTSHLRDLSAARTGAISTRLANVDLGLPRRPGSNSPSYRVRCSMIAST